MSYRNMLDPRSGLFHHTFSRRKHTKSQLNGQTRMSQTEIILRSNAKAHRW
ncbi:YpzG family protein [Bacillus sp. FJAT-27225]|uniref:YpzG family protein n=1 Tax=Bacillus sp. FJAT-27225 TaxID=1743144 RepID=UPI0009817185|nr:YpzG family protein [Bacillus sp. FJAT-27225]